MKTPNDDKTVLSTNHKSKSNYSAEKCSLSVFYGLKFLMMRFKAELISNIVFSVHLQ